MDQRPLLDRALHVDDAFVHTERLILRDHLALVRTRLANERTLMSYVRSALYLILGGLGLLQLQGYGELHGVGYVAVGSAVVLLVVGIYRYVHLRRNLKRYYTEWQRQQEADAAPATGAAR